jgi:hypothetical protein
MQLTVLLHYFLTFLLDYSLANKQANNPKEKLEKSTYISIKCLNLNQLFNLNCLSPDYEQGHLIKNQKQIKIQKKLLQCIQKFLALACFLEFEINFR